MTTAERRNIKKRLKRAANSVIKECRELYHKGDFNTGEILREQWRILFRAANNVDSFDFEEVLA